MAMEKYGVAQEVYEVVKEGKVIEEYLPREDAIEIAKSNEGAIARPVK